MGPSPTRGGDRERVKRQTPGSGTHRHEVRVGEHQQALACFAVQERLHRDARGLVVHQRIGRFRLALERRHHARLEPVLQDVIGIPLDLLRGLLVGHRGCLRAHGRRAREIPDRGGDPRTPPGNDSTRRGAVPKLARRFTQCDAASRLRRSRRATRARGFTRYKRVLSPAHACVQTFDGAPHSVAGVHRPGRARAMLRARGKPSEETRLGGVGARFKSNLYNVCAVRRSKITGRPFERASFETVLRSSKPVVEAGTISVNSNPRAETWGAA